MKRKINSKINIRLIVKINDKCNKQVINSNILRKVDFQASKTYFFPYEPVHYCVGHNVISIISFNTMPLQAVKSLVSFMLIQRYDRFMM